MKCSDSETKARGRPRQFDPDAALGNALRVFWKHGYDGASLAELTEAMGINKPSLYACFGNKEELFKKALDLYERDKLSFMRSALEAPSARAVAERLLRGSLETFCGSAEMQGCMGITSMVACATEAASIREHVIARRKPSEVALVARLQDAIDEGDLPAGSDPQALAQCLSTFMQGLAVKAQAGLDRAELERAIQTFLAMWPGR